MKIPFTNYDLHVSRRGMSFVKNGKIVSFTDWANGISMRKSTPIMEEVYETLANEFAKIDLRHVTYRKEEYKYLDDELNYIVSERPNPYQTKFDFLFTMMYQRAKHGNAFAFLHRDADGYVIRIDPINAEDYMFGNGYVIEDGLIMLKFKNMRTGAIELHNYKDIIHLRANPNNIFRGDIYNGLTNTQPFIDLVEYGLGSMLRQLEENGTVRGVIEIGSAATGLANKMLAGNEEKKSKQQEIVDRIKSTKGGILVLDAGETWKSLANPFSTANTTEIDKYISLLLEFRGINKKVVDGSATEDEMEVFFSRNIAPAIDQFIAECNYKFFSKTSKTQGHRIEFYRNPYEYVSIVKAIDAAYKGIQDTTTNERRRMIYKLPPVKGGDKLTTNKNFEVISDDSSKGESQDGKGD